MAFNTEVGGASSTSYSTVAEADAYHEMRLYADDWDTASNTTKEKSLMWATRLLDENVDWTGVKADDDQSLRWPRYGTYDADGYAIDNDVIPQAVKYATAELALALIQNNRTAEPDTVGFKSLKVAGVIDFEVDKSDRDQMGVLPDSVQNIIAFLGTVKPRSPSVVKLVRS